MAENISDKVIDEVEYLIDIAYEALTTSDDFAKANKSSAEKTAKSRNKASQKSRLSPLKRSLIYTEIFNRKHS